MVAIDQELSGERRRDPYWDLIDGADLLPDLSPADRDAAERGRFEDGGALAVRDLS